MSNTSDYILYNGRDYECKRYFLDTDQTYLDRVCAKFRTLPKYVYIDNKTTLYNLLDIVQNSKDILSVIQTNSPFFRVSLIIEAWLAYHELTDMDQLILETQGVSIDDIDTARQLYVDKDDIEAEIKRLVVRVNNLKKVIVMFGGLPMSKNISEYTITRNITKYVFQSTTDLNYIFDKLIVNDRIPLIRYKSLIKVTSEGRSLVNSDYIDVDYITIYTFNVDNELSLIHIKIHEGQIMLSLNTSEDSTFILAYVKSIIQDELLVYDSNEGTISFTYNKSIDYLVFADILMNVDVTYTLLSFNDNILDTTNTRKLYYKTLTMNDNDNLLRSNTSKVTIDKVEHMRFKTENNDLDVAIQFYGLISRVLVFYEKYYKSVSKSYRIFANLHTNAIELSPVKVKDSILTTRAKLIDVEPRIFGEGYSQKCQPKHRKPIFVADDDYKKFDDKDYSIMRFPKEETNGIQPRWYACTSDTHKYIGLLKSKTSEIDGLALCCFTAPQDDRALMKAYLSGSPVDADNKEPKKEPRKRQYIITTHKMCIYGQRGIIPEGVRLQQLLNSVYPDSIVYRVGVDEGVNSLLHAMFIATGRELSEDFMERQATLKQFRERMLSVVQPQYLKQEMYDMSISEIEAYVIGNEYLDPLRVFRLIESVFECNLVVFVRDRVNFRGNVAFPHSTNGYYTYYRDPSKPLYYLYVHTSTPNEKLKYPHCELLLRTSTNNIDEELPWTRDFTSDIIKFQYIGNMAMRQLKEPVNIVHQSIDISGKVMNITRIDGTHVHLKLPIPPMNIALSPSTYVEGQLDIFQQTEKRARALVSILTWFFSTKIQQGITPTEFEEKHMGIDTNFQYPIHINNSFDIATISGIIVDDIFICNSRRLYDSLIYKLRLTWMRQEEFVRLYYKRKTHDNYYMYPYDFKVTSNDTIVFISDTKSDKNNNVQWLFTEDKRLYITSKCDTLDKALTQANIWKNEGYFTNAPIVSIEYSKTQAFYIEINGEIIQVNQIHEDHEDFMPYIRFTNGMFYAVNFV